MGSHPAVGQTHSVASLLGVQIPAGDAGDRSTGPGSEEDVAPARILLVEDDVAIREAVETALQDEGYRVTCAANGREAMDLLLSGAAADLIILDLRMPIMDGWEFRAVQKSNPAIAAIPIIAVSADGSAQAAAIDAEAYLRKPLSIETLLGTIGRILTERERKHLVRRLEEAERFAALGRLAATVGHEINNPLAYLMINVDLVVGDLARLAEGPDEAAQQLDRKQVEHLVELLGECRSGLDRIRGVVRNLQSLSRPPEPRREPFSVNDVLDRTIAMGRHRAEHRAKIVRTYGELPAVVGDPSALGQVFLNLLLNAADAIPEGHAPDNEITVRSLVRGSDVIVEVSDTGPGVPRESLPHLFEPFYTTKRLGEGTGLGLSVSRRIVADHQGRIEVLNNPTGGATFRVVLPIGRGKEPDPSLRSTPPIVYAGARGRVLVIDDEPLIGRTIEAALAGEYEVTAVSLASDAFARLAAGETFDVVLCDLLMPEMTGRDVYERLLSDWPRAARSVVFLTGGAFTPETSDFVNRTSRPVLFKPFRIDELRATVRAQMHEQTDRHN
jgi:signal transduction histidine kinase